MLPDNVYSAETDNSEAPKRHAEYYFTLTTFLVENELFRVPSRNFAIESEIFSAMFHLPVPTNGIQEGSSDDRPIRLDGIKKSDFILLLRVMFPLETQSCDLLSTEEWTSVLELSTMWQFQGIRERAIKALESLTLSMDPVDKIVMARKFDVSPWLVSSLLALVQREKPLNLSEGNRLGLECALKVAEIREYGAVAYPACQYCLYDGPHYNCGSCRRRLEEGGRARASLRTDYDKKIRKMFGLE